MGCVLQLTLWVTPWADTCPLMFGGHHEKTHVLQCLDDTTRRHMSSNVWRTPQEETCPPMFGGHQEKKHVLQSWEDTREQTCPPMFGGHKEKTHAILSVWRTPPDDPWCPLRCHAPRLSSKVSSNVSSRVSSNVSSNVSSMVFSNEPSWVFSNVTFRVFLKYIHVLESVLQCVSPRCP